MRLPNDRTTLDQSACADVRGVYEELACRPVDRNCVRLKECCHFKLTGRTPFLTRGEAIVAARALRQTGRTKLPPATNGACPMLQTATGNCLIYEARPFGCRTHFCAAAGGPYERSEVIDLIRRLEEIDARIGGNGPHKIEEAVSLALEELA
jgi:Fe-S-cluster containining protein